MISFFSTRNHEGTKMLRKESGDRSQETGVGSTTIYHEGSRRFTKEGVGITHSRNTPDSRFPPLGQQAACLLPPDSCLLGAANRRPVSCLLSPVSSARPSGRAGFSLLELMAVMTIMLILALVTIPAFAKLFRNNNQVEAVNEVSAMIAQGHALALKLHQQVAVVFYEETSNTGPGYLPVGSTYHSGETAITLAVAPTGQPENGSSTTNPLLFAPYQGESVQYLPPGMVVATLTSASSLNVATTGGVVATCRAIVFDASGHMVLRSYLGSILTTNVDTFDWQFISTINPSPSIAPTSSPGVVVYEPSVVPAADMASPALLESYLTTNNDILIVNSYTGNVIR